MKKLKFSGDHIKTAIVWFGKRIWERKLPILILCFFFPFYLILNREARSFPIKRSVLIIIVGIAVILSFSKNWAKNALITILAMGTIFCFLTPIFEVPDEPVHMQRAMYTAEGNLFLSSPENLKLSKSYLEIEKCIRQSVFNKNNLHSLRYSSEKDTHPELAGTNATSFISYIPQVLGINIGRLLGLPLIFIFILSRMLNLITYAILIYFAIKITPAFKASLFVLSCLPMSVYLAASINQDAVFIGLGILSVAYFIKLYHQPDGSIRLRQILFYALLCGILITCKLPYVCLFALVLFLPPRKFTSRKLYFISWIPGAVLVALSVLWFLYSLKFPSPYAPVGTGAIDQIRYILSHFLGSSRIILKSLVDFFGGITCAFTFGWLTFGSTSITLTFLLFFGAISIFYPRETISKSKSLRLGSAFTMALIYGMIGLSMYLTWTPVGTDHIAGLQGRYFIVLYSLLPLVLNIGVSKECVPSKTLDQYDRIIQYTSLFFIMSIFTLMLNRYYI